MPDPANRTPVADAHWKEQSDGDITPRDGQPVAVDQLQHNSKEDVPQSVWANITEGRPVGYAPGVGVKSVTPSGFADDSAALQAIADWLKNSSVDSYDVHVPARKPDGSNWSFPSTVTFGDDAGRESTNLIGHGFGEGQDEAQLNTTITNGDPVFRLTGDTSGGSAKNCNVVGFKANFGHNDVGFLELREINLSNVCYNEIRNFKGDAITLNGQCFENVLHGNVLRAANTGTSAIKMVNDVGTGVGGATYVTQAERYASTFGDTIHDTVGYDSILINGKVGTAEGTANVYSPNGMSVLVGGVAAITDTSQGAHGIYMEGGNLVCKAATINQISGDGIHIDSTTPAANAWISPNMRFESVTGDAINYSSEVDSHAVIPRKAAVKGTVTYPSAGWNKTQFHDGFALADEGTGKTISANTRVDVTNGLTSSFQAHYIEFEISNDPNTDVHLSSGSYWDDSAGRHGVWVENHDGTDVNIDWRAYYKHNR